MILFYATFALFVLGGVFVAFGILRARRRETEFFAAPFPETWEKIIALNVPAAATIPPELRPRFRAHVKRFLAKTVFEPCGGLAEISDEIALTVAANASLLACGSDAPAWQELRAVLIYPRAFPAHVVLRNGKVVAKSSEQNDGESWGAERVALSWERIRRDIALCGNAQNVVVHEFAHQFDATRFAATPRALRERWAEIASREMAEMRDGNPETIIDEYGEDDPVEFFAAASEAFFETPEKLRAAHAQVYATLAEIYGVSPADWHRENSCA